MRTLEGREIERGKLDKGGNGKTSTACSSSEQVGCRINPELRLKESRGNYCCLFAE